ncbi:MAG: DnaJ domain-containing protein [Myxococcota bacterium]|nr:DnaJ domain-containing protein [Myxococcota bacterium]
MDEPNTRPAPAASGILAKTPFLHLLVYALDKELTGSFELFAPDKRTAAILFVKGHPAKVRTSEPVAYLGRVLLELGHVTDDQLSRSLTELSKAKAAKPMLHGQLLLAQGVIDAPKLKAGLQEQLARKLRYAAGIPSDTKYAYYDGFDALRGWGGDGDPMDPVPLFWGMLLEYAPWEHVNAALARVSASQLRLAPSADLERLHLKNDELAAARLLLARPIRASEIAGAARLNDRTGQLLAYLLLMTKQVEVLTAVSARPSSGPADARPRTRKETSSAPPAPATKQTVAPKATRNSTPVPPPTLSPELAERWREIVDRAGRIDRADYFMMLDIARDATHEEVEAAFFALVKRWHPDRLPAELAPVRDACSRVFARMSEAHGTLADDERRSRYMGLLADGSGSPEMQATVAKVIEAATSFQKAEVCLRRNDWAQAETFCTKAHQDDETQPDYLAMLAWLLALKVENQSPEKTVQSIQMLERAIAMNDKCERAYFWRGMLLKRLAKNDLAVKDFKRAVELNPHNIDAAREVRLYNMRGGGRRSSKPPSATKRSTPSPPKSEDAGRQSILGRLFKKP